MFIFTKILCQLLLPLSLLFFVLFTGLFLLWFKPKSQKTGKILVTASFILLLLFSYEKPADFIIKSLEDRYPPYNFSFISEEKPVFIVVLGGGITPDPKLPITSQIYGPALVRLVEGIRIYRGIPGSKLILSGGEVYESIPESKIMADIAKSLGIDEKHIIVEDKSRDTEGQAKLLKSILGDNRFVLVTSASHMPRAMALFKKLGMNPVPAPTEHLAKENQPLRPSLSFFSTFNLHKVQITAYEYLGLIWAKIRGKI